MSRSFESQTDPIEVSAPKKRLCSNGYKASMFTIALICALAFFACLGTVLYGGAKYDLYSSSTQEEALSTAYKNVAGGMIVSTASSAIDRENPNSIDANGKAELARLVDGTNLTSIAVFADGQSDPMYSYEGKGFGEDDVWLDFDSWFEVGTNDEAEQGIYFDENGDEIDDESVIESQTMRYTVECTVAAEPTEPGSILDAYKECTWMYSIRIILLALMIAFFAVALVAFILLLRSVAHSPGTDELVPGRFSGVPFDIMTVGAAAIVALLIFLFGNLASYTLAASGFFNTMAFLMMFGVVAGAIVILWSMALASRIKLHTLWSGLVISRLGRWIARWLKRFSLIKRTVIIIAAVVLVELIMVAFFVNEYDMGGLIIFFAILNVIFIAIAISAAWNMRGLEEAREQLASGNYDYRVDISKMHGGLKRHGEDLNAIAEGLSAAVEEGIRSERMRTELITNVSHDIKTPVTSIVNYADLLSKEETDNEKIREYTEVIGRQANRLKHLVSDLVDASKASSGTVEINLERCDLGIILEQVVGEFEFKLEDQGLQLVIDTRAENVAINADTRHLWRIFNNLMGNICKYSTPGTRVYVTLERAGDKAVITFRNTSRDALNITAEELMERFVRGDQSRSTEGSGLGLAIARSLTELQGGTFDLQIDGDLFKAILSFPACD